ncbi:MAG TPA: cation:proton antiporter [Streptosporangiaceae bacterium]|nr:cation:proton antiporter [Streptosporangiaceae bacterium]
MITFTGVLIIAAIAVLVSLVVGLFPKLPVPGAVLEVIAGILIGPAVLGWVHIDAAITVLSDLGLGMLLFLAGLEIDTGSLRGPLGRLAGLAFAGSVLLGVGCGYLLAPLEPGSRPLFLAIVLMSTSAGLVLPLLTDAREEDTPFGQLVMTAAALAEVATITLLSLFFSAASKTTTERVASLVMFLVLLAVSGLALARVRRLDRLERMLNRLDNQSAQLRVRGALTLALAFGVLAYRFGFASILGAFAAGLLARMVDLPGRVSSPQFRIKLQGIGFGFLIPIFFIATGVQFDLRALLRSPTALAEVPLFLLALLVVRGLPALAYRRRVGLRRAAAAGLMQATTLIFIIVATQIGLAAHLVSRTTSASLLAAGLLSAAVFPAVALRLMAPAPAVREPAPAGTTPPAS